MEGITAAVDSRALSSAKRESFLAGFGIRFRYKININHYMLKIVILGVTEIIVFRILILRFF